MAFKGIFDKFKKKFNFDGKSFGELLTSIFSGNKRRIEDRIVQDTQDDWKKQEKKIGKLNLPKAADFLTPDAKMIQLEKINGEQITNTVKEKMLNDLKRAFEADKKTFNRGEILNERVMNNFRKNLKGTFDEYTKSKNGLTPSKIEQIALIESRNIVNRLKYVYNEKVLENNPDVSLKKKWRHYPSKSKVPRLEHGEKQGEIIDFALKFEVKFYEKGKFAGIDLMSFPHDPEAPIRQKSGCHCDFETIAIRKGRDKNEKN